jgi:4-amino-4-deoxy-L-arabinose transferase-like glycosyltransferase
VLICALYLYRLDASELTNIDEGRSGTIVRDMAEGGQWLLPRTPDGYYAEKPIFYYGLCALLAPLLGIDEQLLRGVSAMMALGTLGLTWILARLYGPPSAAWIAAGVLAGNLMMLRSGRSATVDMTLAFLICGGLTAYFAARQGRLKPWPAALLCGVCFGLATLTKGPIGMVLPGAVLVCLHGLETRGRFWRVPLPWAPLLAALALCSGLALAWYVPAYLHGGREFLETSLLSENLYMPLGAPRGLGVGHVKSLLYYPIQQLIAFITVAPLLPLVGAWLRGRASAPARAQLGSWFGAGLAVLTLAANKRAYYLLPLQPAAAAAIGLACAAWLEQAPPTLLRRGCAAFGAGVVLAAGWGLLLAIDPSAAPAETGEAARRMLELGRGPLCAVAVLGLGCGGWFLVSSLQSTRAMVSAALAMATLALAARTLAYEPVLGRLDHTRPFVASMLSALPPGARPALVGGAPGYALDFYWPVPLIRNTAQAERSPWLFVALNQVNRIEGAFQLLGIWGFPDSERDLALIWRQPS